MAGLLDGFTSYLPQGLLNGDPDALAKALMAGDTEGLTQQPVDDPYAAFDKKQKDIAAKKAALSPFDGGPIAPAPIQPGISGQQVMNIGPFGSLSPMMPQQPQATTPLDAKAESVPLPVPRPTMPAPAPAPSPSAPLNITPNVANANASDNAPVPDSSLLGRIGQALQTADSKIAPHTATLLALAGGLAGAPSWGSGIGRGLTQAAAALPLDQKLNMQMGGIQQTYKALVSSGVPPQLAIASVYNPEILKSTLQNYITDRQWKPITINDGFGGQRIVAFNPFTQETKDITAAQGTEGGTAPNIQSVMDSIVAKRDAGATPQQLLQEIPAAQRDYVGALLSGNALPSNMGRSVDRAAVIKLAHAVDPTFDETMIPTRVKMRQDFAGEGKNGQAIASFNTAQHHIDKLSDDLENLAKYNGNFPTINAARGWLANKANTNPQLRDSLQAVNDDMAAVSHEVANAYNAGHLSDHDMATWNKLTNSDLPPDQLRRGLADFVDLLNGKRDSLNHMYQQTFHTDAPSIDKERNDAITAKVHQRLMNHGVPQQQQATSAPVQVATKADYDKLPKGASYIAPDGSARVKQ